MKGRELATVLAALRYWQQDLEANDAPPISREFFTDCEPLTSQEIDRLCERLNMRPAPGSALGSEGERQPAQQEPSRYLYRPLLRPAGFATIPAGLKWDYVEVPREIAHLRQNLPVSRHRYGVIACDRELTEKECRHFDLKQVPEERVAKDSGGHTSTDEPQSYETHLAALRPFVSRSQWEAMAELARTGEERQFFREKAKEFGERIASMSQTYAQDGKGDQATVHLHYFHGGSDWYITEKDMNGDGTRQAFGYAVLNGNEQNAELGYIDISELTACGVELDLHFSPCALSEVKALRAGEREEPTVDEGRDEDPGESR